MITYELQVYQNGNWKFDSYFDHRDIVISEAERIEQSGKFMGVRVLEESFDEATDKSSFTTIFSRLKKINDDAKAAKAEQAGTASTAGVAKTQKGKQKKTSFTLLMVAGVGLMLVGIAAVVVLRMFAGGY